MSASYCSNLVVDLRPGTWTGFYLSVLTGCMLLSVLLSGIEPPLKIVFILGLSAWGLERWRSSQNRLQTVIWQASDDWRLRSAAGGWKVARLLHAWSAGPALMVLFWKDESGVRQFALVTPDTATDSSRRRLSCHLRWRPKTASQHRNVNKTKV